MSALFAVALLRLVQFLQIYISQGSVATRLRCGGNFNNSFIANCPQNVSMKEFLKVIDIWRRYGHKFGGTFLWSTVYMVTMTMH